MAMLKAAWVASFYNAQPWRGYAPCDTQPANVFDRARPFLISRSAVDVMAFRGRKHSMSTREHIR
jgi:hypothetical protein